MKSVFLDDLPRYKEGRYNGKIDWCNAIGACVRFIYEDIEGEVQIVGYNKKNGVLIIAYDGGEFEISTCHFSKCKLGKLLNKITSAFKIEVGQVLKDNKRDLVIIDKQYIEDGDGRRWKYYKYKCNNCSFTGSTPHYDTKCKYKEEHWVLESNLLSGQGCACCCSSPQIVVPSINSLYTTDKWMCDLGVDAEESKMFVSRSNKKIKVKCPHCGREDKKQCNAIYTTKSISCVCSDGVSYPEKFISNVLTQLKLNFETQYSPKWIGKRFYDFYLKDINTIIEVHGGQHYKETTKGRSLQEEQENDRIKKELALNNGVVNYIILDCRESNLEWVKNSILNSELNNMLDLSNINWFKCEEFAIKSNIVKEICNYWNNKEEWETTVDLAVILKVSKSSITKYLKQGQVLGWCKYNAKEEIRKRVINLNKLNCKKVEVFRNGISLGMFSSCVQLEKQSEELFGVKLLSCKISEVCNGKTKHHKGYTFKYTK